MQHAHAELRSAVHCCSLRLPFSNQEGSRLTCSERHELRGGGGETLDPALNQPPKRGKEEEQGWVECGGVPHGVCGG